MQLNMTILQRGLVLVIVPFLIQATFAWLVSDIHHQQSLAQEQSLKTKDLLDQARQALTLLLEEESAVRGYVITGDPTFNQSYTVACQQVPGILRKLESRVADNPDQRGTLKLITEKSLRLLEWHATKVRAMQEGTVDAAIAAVKSGEGKRQMDELRGDFERFIDQIDLKSDARQTSFLHAQTRLRELVFANSILGFVAMISLALIFYQGISHRLQQVVENTRRMAADQPLLPALSGTDEIAELDLAFHTMATNLRGARAAVVDKMNLLQSVLDNMSEGVMMIDHHGKFLLHNPAAAEMLGIGAHERSSDSKRSSLPHRDWQACRFMRSRRVLQPQGDCHQYRTGSQLGTVSGTGGTA